MKKLCWLLPLLTLFSCYQPQRDCQAFRNGNFTFTANLNGEEVTTRFVRSDSLEVSHYAGNVDSASVRWINDCEYILTDLHPESRAEAKPIHMKILSTTENSYTFEYKIVGTPEASRGTAFITE
ncbi:DNA topoisomerase IV [Robiginitalea sp. M366]|uniref:DNA topoisomerase IV n=1 Tax=Robiginitalea aestuariiviva TaxID=3036903 RepID=UPI00240D9EEA|nr:DNA topoisomerase IV [Robiginitalea aestuariiviva]MDG1572993.1 DNA topoisomerase IV [Robiginitalea aestuariiviva]